MWTLAYVLLYKNTHKKNIVNNIQFSFIDPQKKFNEFTVYLRFTWHQKLAPEMNFTDDLYQPWYKRFLIHFSFHILPLKTSSKYIYSYNIQQYNYSNSFILTLLTTHLCMGPWRHTSFTTIYTKYLLIFFQSIFGKNYINIFFTNTQGDF